MHEKTLNESMQLIGTRQMQSAERQDNEVHHQEDSHSVKQAAYEPMVREELQPTAGKAVERRRSE